MNRQINEDKKMAIEDILQSSNTLEKGKEGRSMGIWTLE